MVQALRAEFNEVEATPPARYSLREHKDDESPVGVFPSNTGTSVVILIA
jgi:hypothetical protein